ncbi:Uncharacterised protein [Yersinia intermedia]|nr:Uncharacterised protein [Yersinia intermedia]
MLKVISVNIMFHALTVVSFKRWNGVGQQRHTELSGIKTLTVMDYPIPPIMFAAITVV